MRKYMVGLLLVLAAVNALAQGFLRADKTQIVNEKNQPVILKGIGLGGWMLQEGYMLKVQGIGQQQHVIRGKIQEIIGAEKTNQFYKAWLANHTRKIDIDSMKAWGFNSVRLAMHYNLFTLPTESEPMPGQNTWIETGFAMTDSLLQWCAANEMYLILDLHAAPGGQGNDLNISDRNPSLPSLWDLETNQQKTIALWKKLAERYSQEPWIGAYDIINEPNWGFQSKDDKNGCNEKENAPLKKLMIDITSAIREVDKNHIIVIEGNCWGNNYNGVLPTWDNNMVLSFHKYWNYNTQEAIQGTLNLREQYQVPIWLGETGENSNLWFRDAIHLMDQNNIGWAWWPLKKLGHNNPLQVKTPAAYQKLLDYWEGKGPKPTEAEAFNGLMEFAENLKLENCIYHPDVVDAMMRQPYSDAVIPFKKFEAKRGLKIQAVDYDLGRNRFAYFDTDTANYWVSSGKGSEGNRGHRYRNDGVDIGYDEKLQVYFISDIETGEWVQYTLNAAVTNSYTLELTLASSQAKSQVTVMLNGKALPSFSIPDTQGKWKTFGRGKVQLAAGKNVIRLRADAGAYQLLDMTLK
jgi:endoglucanase